MKQCRESNLLMMRNVAAIINDDIDAAFTLRDYARQIPWRRHTALDDSDSSRRCTTKVINGRAYNRSIWEVHSPRDKEWSTMGI